MSPVADVAIVGGGVIGCSVAYYAARRGARVMLFEAERVGTGASGAAAGMLAAESEAQDPGPSLDLMLKSRALHEPLSGELFEETGLDVEHVQAGSPTSPPMSHPGRTSPSGTPGRKSRVCPPSGWTRTRRASWNPHYLRTSRRGSTCPKKLR